MCVGRKKTHKIILYIAVKIMKIHRVFFFFLGVGGGGGGGGEIVTNFFNLKIERKNNDREKKL